MDCVRVADQILNLKVMVSRVSGKAEGKVGKETDVSGRDATRTRRNSSGN
jgi:hypothetical protein